MGFRRVDCLHHLILANLKIGQYAKAKVGSEARPEKGFSIGQVVEEIRDEGCGGSELPRRPELLVKWNDAFLTHA